MSKVQAKGSGSKGELYRGAFIIVVLEEVNFGLMIEVYYFHGEQGGSRR